MCISLTHDQELIASTVITSSFDNRHNITYIMEFDGEVNNIGGFIVFPGVEATIIEEPCIRQINNFADDVYYQYIKGQNYQNPNNNVVSNKLSDSRTIVFDNLTSFKNTIDTSKGNSAELQNLIAQLSTTISSDLSFILCLYPLGRASVAFTYSIEGQLIIPGWENNHSNIEHLSPIVERKTTFIIGKSESSQKVKFKQYIPSIHHYCFPSEIVNYSQGVEESVNGNLKLVTNQFGWHHLQAV